MPNSKVRQQKAAAALSMSLSGFNDAQVAKAMQVSTRTVRRWRSEVEIPDDSVDALVGLSQERREAFIEGAYPLLLKLLDVVKKKIDGDAVSARDASVLINTLVDKIRALGPPPETFTETEDRTTTFVLQGPWSRGEAEAQGLIEGNPADIEDDGETTVDP